MEKITTFKGFDADLKCRDYRYKTGETYHHEGEVKACAGGFHACEYPLDVFSYYHPAGNRFCIVEQSGDISRHDDDSKIASRSITVKAEINLAYMVKAAIEYTVSKADPVKTKHSTGRQSASSATGYQSASSATGDQSASSATGYRSASSATGNQSASSATGDQSASSATGNQSASSATGDQSASSATGYRSASSATGYRSASSATGHQSASSATGHQSASSATGDQSASSATGNQSASSATGYQSASSATGDQSASEITPHNDGKPLHAVAAAFGEGSKARAPEGSAIVCVYRNDSGELIHIRASKIGDNGLLPNVWYTLDESGEFVTA
jgi:hypothetical protein